MIISFEKKFVFVHVYKVAGSSIQSFLQRNGLGRTNRHGKIKFENHCTAMDVRNALGAEAFSNLYSFAFVRNPWDLEFSLYKYMKREDADWIEPMIKFKNFEEYLKFAYYYYQKKRSHDPDAWDAQLDRQQSYVCDADGSQLVNFIGRFEHLQADFSEVMQRIGLNIDTALPHLNISTKGDFRRHYNSRMVDYVSEMRAKDIELLCYSFDNDENSFPGVDPIFPEQAQGLYVSKIKNR